MGNTTHEGRTGVRMTPPRENPVWQTNESGAGDRNRLGEDGEPDASSGSDTNSTHGRPRARAGPAVPFLGELVRYALALLWTGAAMAADEVKRMECKWQPHEVQQHRGHTQIAFPASQLDLINPRAWGHSFIYLPDKNRLILQTGNLQLSSDDHGATWTRMNAPPRRHLTYLGNGKVLARAWTIGERLISDDYGETWRPLAPIPPAPGLKVVFSMGPDLVDTDPATGGVVRLAESIDRHIRFSTDRGITWPTSIKAPWSAETVLVRAANGDIVAATRTSNRDGYVEVTGANMPDAKTVTYDKWRVGTGFDFYCGFGVHISKDNGHTWSPINLLYRHGRHHASPVLMPNNDLVMTYVVRLGYDDTPDGLPQYGIEAVVSHNHGQTWELNQRYVLDKWHGEWEEGPGGKVKLMAPNETYTVLLHDGSLMTSFERGIQDPNAGYHRTVRLVHWRLAEKTTQ